MIGLVVLLAACSGAENAMPPGTASPQPTAAGQPPPATTGGTTVAPPRSDPMPNGSPFDDVVARVRATDQSFLIDWAQQLDASTVPGGYPKSLDYRSEGWCEAAVSRCAVHLDFGDVTKTLAPNLVRQAFALAGDDAFRQYLIFDGASVYKQYPPGLPQRDLAGRWVKVPVADAGDPRPTVSSLGIDIGLILPVASPTTLVGLLRGVASEPQGQGDGGKFADAKQLRAEISVSKALDRATNPDDREAILAALRIGTTTLVPPDGHTLVPVDIFLDADGRLTEFQLHFARDAMTDTTADGATTASLVVDVKVSDPPRRPTVSVPSSGQIAPSTPPGSTPAPGAVSSLTGSGGGGGGLRG